MYYFGKRSKYKRRNICSKFNTLRNDNTKLISKVTKLKKVCRKGLFIWQNMDVSDLIELVLLGLFGKTGHWREIHKQASSNFYTSSNVYLQINILGRKNVSPEKLNSFSRYLNLGLCILIMYENCLNRKIVW